MTLGGELPETSRQFLSDFRRYLDTLDLADARAEYDRDELEPGPASLNLLRSLARDGWAGVDWPVQYGGRGLDTVERWLAAEELAYRRVYAGGLSMTSIGPTILRFGDERQKRLFAAPVLSTDVIFACGYTEPDAGSDLASLRTTAQRRGNDYIVNGQKIYTTVANLATHLWLATRTGPSDSRQKGLSVLVVPVNAAGVEVRPMRTQAAGRTNEVFLSDVRVPVEDRVGPEDGGWAIIRYALDQERLFPTSGVLAQFEALVGWADNAGRLTDRECRAALARLALDVRIGQRFSALRVAAGRPYGAGRVTAAMGKIWVSECRERLGQVGLSMMGPAGQLPMDSEVAPCGGTFERIHTAAPMRKFAGGANEVLRGIVSREAMDLAAGIPASADPVSVWYPSGAPLVVDVARAALVGAPVAQDSLWMPEIPWDWLVSLGWPDVPGSSPPDGGMMASAALLALTGQAALRSRFAVEAAARLIVDRFGGGPAAEEWRERLAGSEAVSLVLPHGDTGLRAETTGSGVRLRCEREPIVDSITESTLVIVVAPLSSSRSVILAGWGAELPGPTSHALDGERVSLAVMDGVELAGDRIIGSLDARQATAVAEHLHVLRAAELCGLSARATQLTVEHVTTRWQYGQPLAALQAVQHRCADMYSDLMAMALSVQHALAAAERNPMAVGEMAAGSTIAAQLGERVLGAASQLHGGVGFIDEHPLPGLFRRVKALQLRMGELHTRLETIATWCVDRGPQGPPPDWQLI